MSHGEQAQSQFFHIELYNRVGSEKRPAVDFIAKEAMRIEGSCSHVSDPRKPEVIWGCGFDEALGTALARLDTEVDALGRKIRRDKNILLAGVASFPFPAKLLGIKPLQAARWEKFKILTLDYLKAKYGSSLVSCVCHLDEAYPHIHFAVVDTNKVADTRLLHDGERARENVARNTGQYYYFEAMRALQTDFHTQVGSRLGLDRLGPRRQRLTRQEWKERKAINRQLADAQEVAQQRHDGLQLHERQLATEASAHAAKLADFSAWRDELEKWHAGLETVEGDLRTFQHLQLQHPALVEAARRQVDTPSMSNPRF